MVEIEKSVIRPTYAEWADIYSLGKELTFYRTTPDASNRPDIYGPINPLPIYQRAVEENIEITKKDMPDLPPTVNHDLFRLMGFNSMSQAKKYIAVMKNPNITNIEVHVDGEEDIVQLEFNMNEETRQVDKSKYIFCSKTINYLSGKLVDGNYDTITSIDAETTRVKFFDFENSEKKDVYFTKIVDMSYDPVNQSYTDNKKDNFLPTVKVLTQSTSLGGDIGLVKGLLKLNHIYFMTTLDGKLPKALNRLTYGRKIAVTLPLGSLTSDVRLDKQALNEVLPQLEPIPNEYKKYEDKLNDYFEPKSAKKLIRRMQYMTRLEARKTREGRGLGKYTGETEYYENRPKLYFGVSRVKGVYNPQTKNYEQIILLSFFIERGERLEPADDMMLFVNEAFVPSYFAESDRNKDWVRISYNIAKDAVDGVISYVKDLQTRYRSRKKLDFSSMSDKMINAFDINLNEIMENSFFSYLTFDKRRGRRLNVKKSNMLKSASDIKNTFNEVLKSKFGPFKEIKDLNKEEMQVFIDEIHGFYKREYIFADTRFNIEFQYTPFSEEGIDSRMRNEGSIFNHYDVIKRKNSLDGDLKQYFAIRNKSEVGEESLMGMLVICYYYNGDELDKIEAVSIVQQRMQYRPNIVQQVNKDISIVYPADEIGVFMYEIMTGMRRDSPLILGRGGGNVSTSPSKVGASFAQDYLDGTLTQFDFVINNMKYNEIRNDFVGYLVGKNGTNKMYQFLFSDSTLQGTEGADTICVGKMDLFYKIKGGSSFTGDNTGFLNRIVDFEDFKNKVTIGLNATSSGSCINMTPGAPKGDFMTIFAPIFLGGVGSDKDFLEGNITHQVVAGDAGIGGTNTARQHSRVLLHAELYKRFGSQFGEFIDSLVRKAVESGEIKLGAKYLKRGTSSGEGFYPNRDNHAIIYTPPEESVEQEEIDEELDEYKKAESDGPNTTLTQMYRNMTGRSPHGREMREFRNIIRTSNSVQEIRDRTSELYNMLYGVDEENF